MTQPSDYAAFVAQAEAAVKDLEDPELKRIAFEKILEDLMRSGDEGSTSPSSSATRPAARPAKKAKTAKTKSGKGGTSHYIRELIEESFFKKPKTISDVKVALENRGHHIALTALSTPLQRLCQSRELRRNRDNEKKTFIYSNW